MLEDMNHIDWNRVGNPDIPRWLEGLTSVDLNIWGRAVHRLAVDVVMEDEVSDGNLRPTTALSSDLPILIIPFLIELLESSLIQSRASILSLLDSLAMYHVRFKDAEGKVGLEKEHLLRASQIFELIRAEAGTYRKLARDENLKVREFTLSLLRTLELEV
ncbi:MAG: hypothetical protein RLP44_31510 [Aggregatilineales bacterium]